MSDVEAVAIVLTGYPLVQLLRAGIALGVVGFVAWCYFTWLRLTLERSSSCFAGFLREEISC